jgi:hypothetical protein
MPAMIFSDNKFRTTEPNVILELITRPIAGSEEEKKERSENSPTFPLVCPEQEYYYSGYQYFINPESQMNGKIFKTLKSVPVLHDFQLFLPVRTKIRKKKLT